MILPLLAIGGAGLLLYPLLSKEQSASVPTGLAWGKSQTPRWRDKLLSIGRELQIDPSYLASIMKAESGLNPHAHLNRIGTAQDGTARYKSYFDTSNIGPETIGGGYIGFMRPTIRSLSGGRVELEELLHMDGDEQLDWVKAFYKLHRKSGILPPWPSLWRTYMATFYPAKAHLADSPNAVLFAKDSPVARERKAYLANPATDRDKDGTTTIGEAMAKIDKIYKNGLSDKNRY